MVHKLKTSILMSIDSCEIERACEIEYSRIAEYRSPGRESPDEPSHCTVDGVAIAGDDGRMHDAFWLIDALDSDGDIKALLMADWDDDVAAAEENRADQRRDDAMMERWA